MENIIVNAINVGVGSFRGGFLQYAVMAELGNGEVIDIWRFYADEYCIDPEWFVGKTVEYAKKRCAYLDMTYIRG